MAKHYSISRIDLHKLPQDIHRVVAEFKDDPMTRRIFFTVPDEMAEVVETIKEIKLEFRQNEYSKNI